MAWTGRIESAHAPAPSMQFVLEQRRPNKTRLQITALGARSVRVFDGVHGWKLHPGRGRPGAEPYTPPESRSAQAAHGIDGPLIDAAANGHPVTLQSLDQIGGRQAYRLSVRMAAGGEEQVWVDAETYLDVRHDRMADGPAGAPRRVSTTYGDYRTVEGLRIPFLITTGGGPGTAPDRMQIETVVLNAPLEDSTFGNPAAPGPSHRARPGGALQAAAPTPPSSAQTAAGEAREVAPP